VGGRGAVWPRQGVGVSGECVDFWVLSICNLFPTAGAGGEGGLPAAAGGGDKE
jgi:hypothetical protein